jgi:methyl-accepting chemotaxis protein
MRFSFTSLNSLSVKIPMLLIASTMVAALAMGVNSHIQSSNALLKAEEGKVESISNFRAGVLKRMGEGFQSDMNLMADSPTVREAYDFLQSVYEARVSKDDSLRNHYVQQKTLPGKTRAEYLGQDDKSSYAIGHRRWHPILRYISQERHFYDLFLITPAGEVIYTVEKESDFATNLRTGPLKATGLARVFENAVKNAATGKIQFEDYEPYSPSADGPAAFMARAMKDESGKVIGVVAAQLPDSLITQAVAQEFSGGGAAYVIGPDARLRTVIERRGKPKLFSQTPHADMMKAALAAGGRASDFAKTLDGREAYVAIAATDFMGKQWFMVADMTRESLYKEINTLAMKNAMIGLGLVLVLSIIGIFTARNITRPINQMRDAVGKLASGEAIDIPGVTRTDELGDLARSLRQVHEAGVAAAQIRSGLDNANVNVMIANPEGRVIYANKALITFFRSHAESFQKQFPSFSAEQILGAAQDQFHRNAVVSGSGEQRSRITIDTLTIELVVSPILDATGVAIGSITEWHNLTDELLSMSEVTTVVDAATRGDFSGRIRLDNKSGVMKDLASGQNQINTIVETAMEEFSETLRRVADGDLVIRINTEHGGRFGQLAGGINDTVSRLAETVSTIQRSANDLKRAASEINAGATDLAKRTEEEASSLEETAATTEELAASVKQTADSSKIANDLSDKARALASDGGTIVHEAIHAMERIEEASKKITDIISVIDDIAFQTNLLALNAAVEAARAGDAGKGFAVVASEVRTLAQRSGQAARDIKELIVGSASQVTEGVKLVHATGKSLDSIVVASGEVARMIATIHSAASEQAHGIEEMSTAVAGIDEMTQQNSALAEQSAASATELMKQLEQLNALVATFRIDTAHQARGGYAAASPARISSTTEPDRLRQLAAEAFSQSRVVKPHSPPHQQPRALRTASGGGGQEWTEF